MTSQSAFNTRPQLLLSSVSLRFSETKQTRSYWKQKKWDLPCKLGLEQCSWRATRTFRWREPWNRPIHRGRLLEWPSRRPPWRRWEPSRPLGDQEGLCWRMRRRRAPEQETLASIVEGSMKKVKRRERVTGIVEPPTWDRAYRKSCTGTDGGSGRAFQGFPFTTS